MKKITLFTLGIFFLAANFSFAQDQNPLKVRELGLTFSNLDNFGLRFKCGSEKTLLRLTALLVNLNLNNEYGRTQDSIDNKSAGYGFEFRVGFEKRIVVVPKFNLILGSDLGIGYNYNYVKYESSYYYQNQDRTQWNVTPAIYFVFGAAYHIGAYFIVSAELTPYLSYSFGKVTQTFSATETVTTQNRFAFGVSNGGASITIAYRFVK
jgi:hypothetical protein